MGFIKTKMSSFFTYVVFFVMTSLAVESKAEVCKVVAVNEALELLEDASERNLDLRIQEEAYGRTRAEAWELLQSYDFILDKSGRLGFEILFKTSDVFSETWAPFKVSFSSKAALLESLNCRDLSATKNWSAMKRSYVAKALSVFNNPNASVGLGETFLELEWSYEFEKTKAPRDLNEAKQRYQSILEQVRAYNLSLTSGRFFANWKKVLEVVFSNEKEGIDYCRDRVMMIDALVENCTNCVGETTLFLSLFKDLGFEAPTDWVLSVEVFKDHIQAVLYNEESQKTFDLTSGNLSEVKGAVYPFKDFIHSSLLGYSMAMHSLEQDLIEDYKPEALRVQFTCFRGFDLGYRTRMQLQRFGRLRSCGRYADSSTPDGVLDNSSRLESYMEEEPEIGGLFGRLGGFFSKDSDEDLMAGNIKQDYTDNVDELNLNSQEEALVKGLDWNDQSQQEVFAQQFDFKKVLTGLMAVEALSAFEALSDQDKFRCSIVRPFVFLEAIGFYYEPGQLYLPSDKFNESLNDLDMVDRRLKAVELIETYLQDEIRYFSENYSELSLKDFLIKSDSDHERVLKFFYAVSSYIDFIGSDFYSNMTYCFSASLLKALVDRSLFSDLAKVFAIFWDYSDQIGADPIGFLSLLDKKLKLPFAFGSERASVLQSKVIYHLLPERENRIFWKGFVDYFLFNKDYFFAPPYIDESQIYGGVRPVYPIKFKDFLELKTGAPRQELDEAPEVSLPQMDVEPCRPEDSGYVRRGLFFIYCDPSERGLEGQNPDAQDERNQEGKAGGKDSVNLQGLDEQNAPAMSLPQEVNADLTPTPAEERTIPSGSPEAQIDLVLSKGIDPRQEVVIEVEYWAELLKVILASHWHSISLLKNYRYEVAVHHLQRDSIETLVADTFPNYWRGLELPYLRPLFYRVPMALINQDWSEKGLSQEQVVDFVYEKTIERRAREMENDILDDFNDSHFREASMVELQHNLKKGWAFIKTGVLGRQPPAVVDDFYAPLPAYTPQCESQAYSGFYAIACTAENGYGGVKAAIRSWLKRSSESFKALGET